MNKEEQEKFDLKTINLEQITFDKFLTYKYVQGKLRGRYKSPKWAAAKITQPIEYASFTKLLVEVIKSDFVKQVGVISQTRKQRREGRFYIVNRNDLDEEKIKKISEIASNKEQEIERFLDVYMMCIHGKWEGFAHLLRFHKLADEKIASTYLQIPGRERCSYTWHGDMQAYTKIYAALPIKRK